MSGRTASNRTPSLRHQEGARDLSGRQRRSQTVGADVPAFIFSLSRGWQPCVVRPSRERLVVKSGVIERGMSGSPIVDEGGYAIGVIGLAAKAPQGKLPHCLPHWLVGLTTSSGRYRARKGVE